MLSLTQLLHDLPYYTAFNIRDEDYPDPDIFQNIQLKDEDFL